MYKNAAYILMLFVSAPLMHSQNLPSAIRRASIQVGVAGSAFTLDYGEGYEKGLTVFGDVDFAHHLGIEALYRNASIITPHDIGENHILAGPRFAFQKGRFKPYAKALAGVGTINFQQGYNVTAYSESYFIYALGGGFDYHLTRRINIRPIDFEYQIWPTFAPNGLTPYGYTAGVAYQF